MKLFSVDQIKIACWINPHDFGVHQQSLIFIHGSGGDHSGWSQQYAKLHKQFNIIAVDLPGHGRSEGNGENDVANYSQWIKKLISVMQPKNPVLIGHSLGAAITLDFALRYSQDLKGIVPVGGGLKMPVNPSILEGLKTNPDEVIEMACKFSLAKENRPRLMEQLKKNFAKATPDALYGDFLACNKFDFTNEIAKIKMPALALCGMEDKMTPPDLSRQIVAGISGAQLCLIEGAGHMVMLEKPAEFNKAVREFVCSLS